MTLDEAMKRERLSDELRAIEFTNVAPQPGESYEDNLRKRAQLRLRKDEILKELAG
jgi:hypothetical protein